MFSLAGALFLIRHALVFGLLAATVFVLGRRLLRGGEFESAAEEMALSIGMGMGAFGLLLFGLGLFGVLTPAATAILVALIHLAGFPAWRDFLRPRTRDGRQGKTRDGREGKKSADVLPWLPAAVTVAVVAILSFYPPTSFDATAYHLPYARAFAQTHRIVSLPARRFPVFPQLTETIFAATLFAGDDTDAQRVEFLALLAGLAVLAAWGRRSSESSEGSADPLAASAWIGCPAVALLAASAYVDIGFSMFGVLAYFSWERWRDSGARGWIVLSAVFAGFSAGVKYHGLAIMLLLGCMTLASSLFRKKSLGSVVAFALISAAVACPWYIRNFLTTGNPVFPFLPRIFGKSPYALSIDAVTSGGTAASDSAMTFGRAAGEWLGAPGRVAHSLSGIPDSSGQTPLSPLLAILALLALFAAFRSARLRRVILFAAAYAVICGGAEVRFLLPAAALVCCAGSAALAVAGKRITPILRATIAAALVLPGAAWATHRLSKLGAVPIDRSERDAFLRRELPAYSAIEDLNRSSGADYTVYAVAAENLAYFAKGNFLGDWFGPLAYSKVYGDPARDPDALDRNLRSIRARYLLIDEQRWPRAVRDEAGIRRHFRVRLRGSGFVLYERDR